MNRVRGSWPWPLPPLMRWLPPSEPCRLRRIALSGGDLDNPILRRQLPGQTGAALQTALNQLHRSVQAGETEREALLERATRDSLTGLLNRGAALEALKLDLAAVHRSRGKLVLTLFFIDLDDLKTINDSIGHDGGDVAIRAVAEALRLTTRASDVIARFGGDEFVVGWLGNPDSDVPEELAKRILPMLRNRRSQPPGVQWRWLAVSVLRFQSCPTVRLRHSSSGQTACSTRLSPTAGGKFVGPAGRRLRFLWRDETDPVGEIHPESTRRQDAQCDRFRLLGEHDSSPLGSRDVSRDRLAGDHRAPINEHA